MPTLAAGELILDLGLYPRSSINGLHVQQLSEALRAGAVFPPVLIDAETRQVIDGFHRTTAILKVYGTGGAVEVEERRFADDIERYLESLRTNTAHGLNLTSYERTQALIRSEEMKIDPALMASVLQMTQDAIPRLMARKTAQDSHGQPMALKPMASHLRGTIFSERQMEANRRAGGQSLLFQVNQLLNAFNGDLVDSSNPIILERLVTLKGSLDSFLGEISIPMRTEIAA